VMHRIAREQLVEIVDGDVELITLLVTEGVIEERDQGYGAEEVDRVLTCRTLVRELEVNWAGVDIVLRLRDELATARRRIAELEAQLAAPGEATDDRRR
jgi:hypothetical protein